jgi:hypothetical protein
MGKGEVMLRPKVMMAVSGVAFSLVVLLALALAVN